MRRTLPHLAVLTAVLALGGLLAAWLFQAGRERKETTRRLEVERRAHAGMELLRSRMARSLEILSSVTALFEARGPEQVSRKEFRDFVQPALSRQPELLALEWIPRVHAGQRQRFEQLASADGLEGFQFREINDGQLQEAGARPEYYPVFYVEPVRGNAPALGLDLGHHALRRAALERAASSGEASATEPILLAQETAARPGFLVFSRVEGKDKSLAGFGLAVFRVESLVSTSLAPLADLGWRVEIRDQNEPGVLLYQGGSTKPNTGPAEYEETLKLAGRQWVARFFPGPGFASGSAGLDVWSGPAWVMTATLLLGAYLVNGMRRTSLIERKVTQKTAELSQEVKVRQRAEEAMRVAEAKYRSMFENAIGGIFQSTLEGRYVSANPALARIYGYETPRDLLAAFQDIGRQLYVEPARREQFIQRIRAEGVVSDFISRVHRKDGSIIWISEKAFAVNRGDGSFLYFEGMVEDVTEQIAAADAQKRASEILEERVADRTAQLAETNNALQDEILIRKKAEAEAEAANRAKSLFLADMSHEIRTPLNAILGYTQLLQRDSTLSEPHAEAVRTIVEGGNHLLCLVDGVLDLTKIEVGRMDLEPVDFDLTVLVKGMAAMFHQRCQQKGLSLRVESLGEKAVWLHGDERKLRQILVNLLSNAVKFTDRGEILLRVVPGEPPGRHRFEVIDTGPGIPEAEQKDIFEPFRQETEGRHKGGTGLGLSISRKLAALMGGELAVKSRPGWGSNFFCALAFESAQTAVPPLAEASFPSPRLPAPLVHRLRAAAEIGDFGAVRQLLDETERLGENPAALARQLRPLARRFNGEAILAALAELPATAEMPNP